MSGLCPQMRWFRQKGESATDHSQKTLHNIPTETNPRKALTPKTAYDGASSSWYGKRSSSSTVNIYASFITSQLKYLKNLHLPFWDILGP